MLTSPAFVSGTQRVHFFESHRQSTRRPARGFSLVELMVVMIIIAILMGLLLPAIQASRGAARSTASRNNLRQIQLAMIHHEVAKGFLPPSQLQYTPPSGVVDVNGWSIFALLLPYLENTVVHSQIDYNIPYANAPNVVLANGQSVKLTSLRIPTYISPGEPRDEARLSAGVPVHYPINYAVNLGTWFVWDPATKTGGQGAAYPESKLKTAHFSDGTGMTMGFAEVKAWGARIGSAGLATGDPGLTSFPTLSTICGLGGTLKNGSNHSEWVDGRAAEIGFTSTFLPNQLVNCPDSAGVMYDTDWSNWGEGKGLYSSPPTATPTYAANTARSYFPGAVNVSMMDGSVRPIANTVNLGVWRAISTRNGQELLPDDFTK